jgi:hypothetical protein
MAFTYDLTTDRGKVRFQVGDSIEDKGPRPTGINYSDAEIDYFLDAGSVAAAVAQAFDTLASEWSSFALSEREGEISYDAKVVADGYRKQAAAARQRAGGATIRLIREDAWTDD